MKNLCKMLIFFCLVSYSFGSLQTSSVPSDEMVDEYLVLTGTIKQANQIPQIAEDSILGFSSQYPDLPLSTEDVQNIAKKAKEAYDSKKMLKTIKQGCKRGLNTSDLKKLISWYKSPVGKKITNAEIKSTDYKSYQNALMSQNRLSKDKELMDISRQINKLTKATYFNTQLIKNQNLIFYCLRGCSKQEEEQISSQTLAQEKQIEQFNITIFAYTYKDIDRKDLKKYLNFLKTPWGQKSIDVLTKYMLLSFNDTFLSLANKLFDFASEQNKKQK